MLPFKFVKVAEISALKDKVLKKVEKCESEDGEDYLVFYTTDDEMYLMHHEQDCCENVYIEEIVGDLEDLVGSSILMAEEVSQAGEERDEDGDIWSSQTWTFYKLATIKGYVTIRWFGESNGFYSESVNFEQVQKL